MQVIQEFSSHCSSQNQKNTKLLYICIKGRQYKKYTNNRRYIPKKELFPFLKKNCFMNIQYSTIRPVYIQPNMVYNKFIYVLCIL